MYTVCNVYSFRIQEQANKYSNDLYEKNILDYAEVYADALNTLLFKELDVVKAYELLEADTRSYYKEEGMVIRKQERDVLKRWKVNNVIKAEFGIENQLKISKDMPLRLYSYDGGRYRWQLVKTNNQEERYPLISLVLNYDRSKWKQPLSLQDALTLDERLRALVPNIPLIVVDMWYLEEEVINQLKSDLRIIAYLLRCKRLNVKPTWKSMKMDHPDEVVGFMCAITGSDIYKEMFEKKLKEGKGGSNDMCNLMELYHEEGIAEGKNKERENGIKKLIANSKKYNASYEECIQDVLESYPEEDESTIRKYVEQIYFN